MVPTKPSAAQGVLRPPCLLSGFAAHQHVVQAQGNAHSLDVSRSCGPPTVHVNLVTVRCPLSHACCFWKGTANSAEGAAQKRGSHQWSEYCNLEPVARCCLSRRGILHQGEFQMRNVCLPFAATLILTLVGCGIEDPSQQAVDPSQQAEGGRLRGVVVIDNTVHFDDIDAFSEAMDLAHSMGFQRLGEFEKLIGIENSLRSKLLLAAIEESEGSETGAPSLYPHDLFFASILNENGVFYNGGTIHKVTDEYEYALEGGDEETLERAVASQLGGVSSYPGLQVHRITDTLAFSKKGSNGPLNVLTGMHTIFEDMGTDPGGNPKRACLEAWSRNYLTYASNGVNLTTQSYRKGGLWGKKDWRDSAVSYMKVDVESRQYSSISGTGYWVTLQEQEEAWSYHHIQEVMDYVVGGGVWIDTDYIDCTYTYVRDNGVTVNKFVHWVN